MFCFVHLPIAWNIGAFRYFRKEYLICIVRHVVFTVLDQFVVYLLFGVVWIFTSVWIMWVYFFVLFRFCPIDFVYWTWFAVRFTDYVVPVLIVMRIFIGICSSDIICAHTAHSLLRFRLCCSVPYCLYLLLFVVVQFDFRLSIHVLLLVNSYCKDDDVSVMRTNIVSNVENPLLHHLCGRKQNTNYSRINCNAVKSLV